MPHAGVCLCMNVNICIEIILIYAVYHICVFFCERLYVSFQDEPRGARCEHEKAAGGGLEDKTEVPAGDGEKLPWTGGGAGEKGTQNTSQPTPSSCHPVIV